MKKNIPTTLVDDYLEYLQPVSEPETDPYFYTRLKARMQKRISAPGWTFPLQPVWLVSMLVLFLFINIVFLVTQIRQSRETAAESTSLQNFTNGYDLSVTGSY